MLSIKEEMNFKLSHNIATKYIYIHSIDKADDKFNLIS